MTINDLNELIDQHDVLKMLDRYKSTTNNRIFTQAKYLALKDKNISRYLSLTIADALHRLAEVD